MSENVNVSIMPTRKFREILYDDRNDDDIRISSRRF